MDTRAMQKGVQQQLNAMDIPLVSEDVIYYLNRAQENFIDEQYVFLRGKYTDQQNMDIYQNAQKAIENLRTVVETEVIANVDITDASHFGNAKSADLTTLTEEFYYYVRSQTRLSDGGEWVNNKLIEQENVQKFVKTKYNSPIFRDFLALLEGDNIHVFYDSQSGADVYEIALTYIRTPGELVLENPTGDEVTESELPKHTHKDLINLAVALIVQDQEGLGNPRLVNQRQQAQENMERQRRAGN